MAGKGGGAWKVAYADFVTAMMAFFMVMWILGQSKEVKQSVAQYFKDPKPASSQPGGPASLLPAGKDSAAGRERTKTGVLRGSKRGKGNAVPEKGHDAGAVTDRPAVVVLRTGSRRAVGTLVLFPPDSAELDDAAKALLAKLAPQMAGKSNRIEIRGRATRSRSTEGDEPETWQLCYARCIAVKGFLEKNGLESERIRLSQAGVYEPLTTHAEAQKQNSSVELYLLDEFVDRVAGIADQGTEKKEKPSP